MYLQLVLKEFSLKHLSLLLGNHIKITCDNLIDFPIDFPLNAEPGFKSHQVPVQFPFSLPHNSILFTYG